jgi:hypothetical protein
MRAGVPKRFEAAQRRVSGEQFNGQQDRDVEFDNNNFTFPESEPSAQHHASRRAHSPLSSLDIQPLRAGAFLDFLSLVFFQPVACLGVHGHVTAPLGN